MTERSASIKCDVHGDQERTYVCQHLAASLSTEARIGFFAAAVDSEHTRPDAWCAACEQKRLADGGEWQDNCDDFLKIKILCGSCYDRVKILNEPEGMVQ